jgi:hypothetical protein
MGASRISRRPVSLLVEVTRNAAGRPEGWIRTTPADPGFAFSGVLELLKVLEDLLDEGDLTPIATSGSEKDTP